MIYRHALARRAQWIRLRQPPLTTLPHACNVLPPLGGVALRAGAGTPAGERTCALRVIVIEMKIPAAAHVPILRHLIPLPANTLLSLIIPGEIEIFITPTAAPNIFIVTVLILASTSAIDGLATEVICGAIPTYIT